jgi:8-amino-7-oxononanoate synthase
MQIQQAYSLIQNNAEREKLFANIQYFNNKIKILHGTGVAFKTNNTPIQSVIIPGNQNAIVFSKYLSEKGFYVKAILSPTVAAGSERVRICLHSLNTMEQIDELVSVIKNYFK